MAKADETEEAPNGGGRIWLVAGLAAAVILGSGGFYAAYTGLIGGTKTAAAAKDSQQEGPPDLARPGVAFVAIEPLVISLGRSATNRYLRFSAELEVATKFKPEVTLLKPRVLDVLNEYLRAVDVRDIEDPAAFGQLRAQMLRRIQVVTGQGRVRDLLISEFVLN